MPGTKKKYSDTKSLLKFQYRMFKTTCLPTMWLALTFFKVKLFIPNIFKGRITCFVCKQFAPKHLKKREHLKLFSLNFIL